MNFCGLSAGSRSQCQPTNRLNLRCSERTDARQGLADCCSRSAKNGPNSTGCGSRWDSSAGEPRPRSSSSSRASGWPCSSSSSRASGWPCSSSSSSWRVELVDVRVELDEQLDEPAGRDELDELDPPSTSSTRATSTR